MEHQRRPAEPTEAASVVSDVLNTAGQPLAADVRAPLEARFGQDFSRVRVHSDARAAASASAVGASAYTVGRHIVFGSGQFRPGSTDGQRLLAHELTHVLQQRDAAVTDAPAITDPADPLEQQAAEAAASTGRVATATVGRQVLSRQVATTKTDKPEDALTEIQGLPMAGLLAALERLPFTVRSDERAGAAVGGPRLALAMRAVAARGSAWEPFQVLHQQELTGLPLDQVGDIGVYLRAYDVGGVRVAIAAIGAKDIGSNWAGRKQQFLAAAGDPSNTLNSAQMYQIWLRYWKDEQVAARAAYLPIEAAEAKPDVVGYADRLDMFKAGRRGILSPAYEAAADRVTAADYYTSDLPDVLGWLEAQVDVSHNHVTLEQVNRKVPALIKDRAIQEFLLSFLTGFARGPSVQGNQIGLSQRKIISERETPPGNKPPHQEKPPAAAAPNSEFGEFPDIRAEGPLVRVPASRDGIAAKPAESMRRGTTATSDPNRMALSHGTLQDGLESIQGSGINVHVAPGAHQDFGQGFYLAVDDLPTAEQYASDRGRKRMARSQDGPLQHVLTFEMSTSELGAVVDIRPGGNFGAEWQVFLDEPPFPISSETPGLRSNREYLRGVGSERRGEFFEKFLGKIGMRQADVIIGPLGDEVFGGVTAGYPTTQMCVRNQAIADRLNQQIPVEPKSPAPTSPAPESPDHAQEPGQVPPGHAPEPPGQLPPASGSEPPSALVAGEDDPAAVAQAHVRRLRAEGKEVIANLGGAGARHEPADGINVNNQVVARKNIRNHVKADGSDLGTLFEPESLDRVEGHQMAPGAIDWDRAAPGAYRTLRGGGRFRYYWRGRTYDAQVCAKALQAAGFTDVQVVSDVLVTARKP